MPWVEKYRPATIDDLQQQDQVVSTLKNAIKTGNVGRPQPASVFLLLLAPARSLCDRVRFPGVLEANCEGPCWLLASFSALGPVRMITSRLLPPLRWPAWRHAADACFFICCWQLQLPHLLFYGPPGTGKTSAILALAKDLFGPQMYRSRVLELNASDERGIDVVRKKIKNFASLAVSANKSSSHVCPPFKLIILDEADSMTVDAQSALRRTMETYSKVTRFCILCNYVSRIIGPIASRCAKFRFQPMSKDVMTARLGFIAEKEGFSLPADASAALLKVSGGDLRRAITLLQNTYMLHGQDMKGQHITDSAAVIPDSIMNDLVAACRSNSFEKMQVAVWWRETKDVLVWGCRGGLRKRACAWHACPSARMARMPIRPHGTHAHPPSWHACPSALAPRAVKTCSAPNSRVTHVHIHIRRRRSTT